MLLKKVQYAGQANATFVVLEKGFSVSIDGCALGVPYQVKYFSAKN
jgi:hypothetical protein